VRLLKLVKSFWPATETGQKFLASN
jgi:hypothetical protein